MLSDHDFARLIVALITGDELTRDERYAIALELLRLKRAVCDPAARSIPRPRPAAADSPWDRTGGSRSAG